MAFTNTDTNMTTSTGLQKGLQTYYDRKLLETFEPELVHLQFGDQKTIPKNNGSKLDFRKFVPIPVKTTPLSEGNPGDARMIQMVNVTLDLDQYGDYARYTDKLVMTHFDLNMQNEAVRWGEAGGRTVDAIARDVLATCTNVIRPNGKTARNTLAATDKLTSKELRRAVKILKKAHAQKFGGWYIAIVGPDGIYDLQDDDAFISVAKYQDKEAIYKGEIGRLFGCRILESTEAKVFTGAGASGVDVASTIVLGQHAYGYSSITGSAKPRVIFKPAGSAGTADPLDQISTTGWKLDLFGVGMLQDEYAVRIEHGFTA